MFLARSFTVPVEPVQKVDMVVTGRPFIPPAQQTTGATSQIKMKKATQPMGPPVHLLPPSLLSQPARILPTALLWRDPRFSPPSPTKQTLPGTSGKSEVQPPDPNGQPVPALKKQAMSVTSTTAPSGEPISDEHFSDHAPPQPR